MIAIVGTARQSVADEIDVSINAGQRGHPVYGCEWATNAQSDSNTGTSVPEEDPAEDNKHHPCNVFASRFIACGPLAPQCVKVGVLALHRSLLAVDVREHDAADPRLVFG